MVDKQQSLYDNLKDIQHDLRHSWYDYWIEYSNIDTWQFWVLLGFFIVPLILIFLFIDKKRPLLLGFYGYNVHVFFTYIDLFGTSHSYWGYPYKFLPILPSSFSLDVSLVPATYMFMYQWILNKQKNYYLYMVLLSAFLSFIFKPLLVLLNLFDFNRGTTYIHLFMGYLVIGVVARIVTNIFIYIGKKAQPN